MALHSCLIFVTTTGSKPHKNVKFSFFKGCGLQQDIIIKISYVIPKRMLFGIQKSGKKISVTWIDIASGIFMVYQYSANTNFESLHIQAIKLIIIDCRIR